SGGWHDVFLDEQLDSISNGLEQAMWSHTHGAKTDLHVGQDLALQPVHRDHRNGKAKKNQQDVNQSPECIARLAGGLIAAEIRGDVIEHQRSTSPSTMSSVPMTAITSATSWPRTIRSNACKFTNEVGERAHGKAGLIRRSQ